MTDRNLTPLRTEHHGTWMHRDYADLCGGLSYGSGAVADLRDPVGADASGVESHAEQLADGARRQTACSLPVAIELDILPAEYEKDSWNRDDHEPAYDRC